MEEDSEKQCAIKESFLIYTSFYKPIKNLSDEQLGKLLRAIFRYNLGEEVEIDDDIYMAFEFFRNQMERDESKYQRRMGAGEKRRGNPNFRKGKANPYYGAEQNEASTRDNSDIIQDNSEIIQDNSGIISENREIKENLTHQKENSQAQTNVKTASEIIVDNSEIIQDNSIYINDNDNENDNVNDNDKYYTHTLSQNARKIFSGLPEVRSVDTLVAELKTSPMWKETVMMRRAMSAEQVDAALDDFALYCREQGKDSNTLSDAKSHFSNWLTSRQNHGTQDFKPDSKIRRRGTDAGSSKPKNYQTTF
jgi:hypothetical protein